MSVHQTSFCFVCCHLTSGEKEGDELRRNSDVYEILKKTRFPRIQTASDLKSPQTILEHEYEKFFLFWILTSCIYYETLKYIMCTMYLGDCWVTFWQDGYQVKYIIWAFFFNFVSRIIWLGDLNYRVALSYHSAKALVEMHNWKLLLEKDQVIFLFSFCLSFWTTLLCFFLNYTFVFVWAFWWLLLTCAGKNRFSVILTIYPKFCILQLRIEKRFGRVFSGWKEGRIYFPPTYKYSNNSDRYSGDDVTTKEKRRTPAW